MDDQTDGTTDGGALRTQLEKALKDMKALQDQNAELTKQVRSTSVKDLFGELKADARGVKFYNGEPTKEALAEWLKADGDVFATAPEAPQAQTPGAPQTTEIPQGFQLPPGITPEMLAAAQASSGMQPTPPAAPTADLDALTSQLPGLKFDKPEDTAKLNDTFAAIRAQAAARLAAGGSL